MVLAAILFALSSGAVTVLSVGASDVGLFVLATIVNSGPWASCLLGALVVLGPRFRVAWVGALAGIALGFVLGRFAVDLALRIEARGRWVLGPAAQSLQVTVAWALADGVVTGALFAVALWLSKPEERAPESSGTMIGRLPDASGYRFASVLTLDQSGGGHGDRTSHAVGVSLVAP